MTEGAFKRAFEEEMRGAMEDERRQVARMVEIWGPYVPLSVRYSLRKRIKRWIENRREVLALRLAPWLRY